MLHSSDTTAIQFINVNGGPLRSSDNSDVLEGLGAPSCQSAYRQSSQQLNLRAEKGRPRETRFASMQVLRCIHVRPQSELRLDTEGMVGGVGRSARM